MLKNEGVFSFYRGLIPSILMSVYGIIQMFAYENLNHLVGFKKESSSFWITFITGGFSKCIASSTLLPLTVIRTRL
jgi:hypothetical protein